MSKKFFLSFLLFFTVTIVLFFTIEYMLEDKPVTKKVDIIKKADIVKKSYKYRKYLHVEQFYKEITKDAIEIGMKYNVPPPALLAIAGVESGYGRGYVAHITGNILSLGANSNEPELPALYLPNLKSDSSKVLFGAQIYKYKDDELIWKNRPNSLKKDYRPKGIAGSPEFLDYLDTNPSKKREAHYTCMEDFASKWISLSKKFKPFVDARKMLDEQVKLHSKEILFDRDLNIKFIYMIGGKENSFNYRKSWPKKVVNIMDNVGLLDLTYSLHVEGKTFKNAWAL